MPKLLLRPTIPRPDDPELLATYTESIALGLPLTVAATNARIHDQTARDWMNKGEAEMEANSDDAHWEPSPHAAFAWAVKQAEARFVTENVGVVAADRDASPVGKRWISAMTLLERRRPRDFGRQQYVDIKEERTLTLKLELPPGAVAALSRTLNNTKLLAAPSEEQD